MTSARGAFGLGTRDHPGAAPLSTSRSRRSSRWVALFAGTLVAAGCSSGSTVVDKIAPPKPLQILVTNDDGFAAPGIDVVARALTKLPNVRVTIVAPATNKSGTGSQTIVGTLTATKRKTASGLAATAVDGFPSDAIRYALDTMKLRPDVVVSGINAGQNLGPITEISGTVGAAKAAAAKGIPAIAASQGEISTARTNYGVGAKFVTRWVDGGRHKFSARTAAVGVVNVNFPMCTTLAIRGVRQVPLAAGAENAVTPADCASTLSSVNTDVEAFHNGFIAVTQLDPAGQTVTSSTTWPST